MSESEDKTTPAAEAVDAAAASPEPAAVPAVDSTESAVAAAVDKPATTASSSDGTVPPYTPTAAGSAAVSGVESKPPSGAVDYPAQSPPLTVTLDTVPVTPAASRPQTTDVKAAEVYGGDDDAGTATSSSVGAAGHVAIVMGVTGAGKTTVGRALALHWSLALIKAQAAPTAGSDAAVASGGTAARASSSVIFHDADDFHSAENKTKMASGTPLTDEDRKPWLTALSYAVQRWLKTGQRVVLACSALKRTYRDTLRGGVAISRPGDGIQFFLLSVPKPVIAARVAERKRITATTNPTAAHFMNPALVDSQFATLELPVPDESIVTVLGTPPVDVIVPIMLSHLVVTPIKTTGNKPGGCACVLQ